MARVDVWLPVRDAARTLRAALESVRRQTFRDWRLLVVDDGSSDGSGEIARRAAGEDRRIRVLARPAEGLVAALRAAEAASDAPWIARMDADDVAHPARFERQLALDGDIRAARVRVPAGPEGMRVHVRWQNALTGHDEIVNNLFVDSPIAHPTVLMSRAAYAAAGGYREGAWAEDFDLWHRAREAGLRFAKAPRILLSWRDSPGRLTRTHAMYERRAMERAKLHYLLRHPILRRGPVTIWGAGPTGRAWARDLLAAGIEVAQAIDIDRRKVGRVVAGSVPVRDPEEGLARRAGPVLGAVGSRGAREEIRGRLLRAGLAEGGDFLFLA